MNKNNMKWWMLLWASLACTPALAQKFSDDPTQFLVDVKTVMAIGANPVYIQTGADFEANWKAGAFSAEAQKTIIRTCQAMGKKSFRTNPHFYHYYLSLNAAYKNQRFSGGKMDTLALTSEWAANNYDALKFSKYIETLKNVMEIRALYYSGSTSMYVRGGEISVGLSNLTVVEYKEEPVITNEFNNVDNEENFNVDFEDLPVDDQPVFEDHPAKVLPSPAGPYIKFVGADLMIKSQFDSAFVKGTRGFMQTENFLVAASGGSMSWANAGLPDAVATFKTFTCTATSGYLMAEAVSLAYPGKLDKPVDGIFEYKGEYFKTPADAKYPRFMSYRGDLEVKNLAPNLKFKGGFSLNGQKVSSSSVDDPYATLTYEVGGKKSFQAIATRFEFSDAGVRSELAAVILYMDKDSITHPGVLLEYQATENRLRLFKHKGGFKNAMYFSSYHKLELEADHTVYSLNTGKLDFFITTARDQIPAIVESINYFNAGAYERLRGIYDFHPVSSVVEYTRKNKATSFNVIDLAKFKKQSETNMRSAMVLISRQGYITYDQASGMITPLPKAFNSYSAYKGTRDYDNINIPSIVANNANATLDFNTKELLVRGVEKLYLSDSMKVYIMPKNKELTILQNRDMRFDGNVFVGSYRIMGRNFKFDYDSFYVDLVNIDKLIMRVETGKRDATGAPILRELNSSIENTAGKLYINKPDNKANRKRYPIYPIFKSYKGSNIYYNKKTILNGVYDSTRFYFQIPAPLILDSLNANIDNGISFPGTFYSDVFPPIVENLTVMPDYSLGFDYDTPSDGLKIYGGKGLYKGSLHLSDSLALRGNGIISYLTGTFNSKDYLFYLDSCYTHGTTGVIASKYTTTETYPDVTMNDYYMMWHSRADTMYLENVNQKFETSDEGFSMFEMMEHPFKVYHNLADFRGLMKLFPGNMAASGMMFTSGAEIISPAFKFKKDDFEANHAYLLIKTDSLGEQVLHCRDINIDVDLNKKHAVFEPSVDGEAAHDFTVLQIKSTITHGDWDMKGHIVRFSMPTGADSSKSYFYSYDKAKDSLSYRATYAEYRVDSNILSVKGIPYIDVADTKVIPDNGEITVLDSGRVELLKNAVVVSNSKDEYHTFTQGTIEIYSSKTLAGAAEYKYLNSDSVAYTLKFTDFIVQPLVTQDDKKNSLVQLHTVAVANVSDEDSLRLEPQVLFKGKITMNSDKQYLIYEGFTYLDLKGFSGSGTWIPYSNASADVKININNQSGAKLFTGLYTDVNNYSVYSIFASTKRNPNDIQVFNASGDLVYNTTRKTFEIGPTNALNNEVLGGNVFMYDNNTDNVAYRGVIEIMPSTSEVKMHEVGFGTGNLDSSVYRADIFMMLELKMPPAAELIMGDNLANVATAMAAPVSYDYDTLIAQKLAMAFDEKTAKAYQDAMAMEVKPLVEMVPLLASGIVFNHVHMEYSNIHNSWFSKGDLGLSNVKARDVNAKVGGYMEVRKSFEGDVLTIYMKPSVGIWFYMEYNDKKKILSLYSSDEEFNRIVRSKQKVKPGKYSVKLANPDEPDSFVASFKEKYTGVVTRVADPMDNLYNTQPTDTTKPVENKAPVDGNNGTPTDPVNNGNGTGTPVNNPKENEITPVDE